MFSPTVGSALALKKANWERQVEDLTQMLEATQQARVAAESVAEEAHARILALESSIACLLEESAQRNEKHREKLLELTERVATAEREKADAATAAKAAIARVAAVERVPVASEIGDARACDLIERIRDLEQRLEAINQARSAAVAMAEQSAARVVELEKAAAQKVVERSASNYAQADAVSEGEVASVGAAALACDDTTPTSQALERSNMRQSQLALRKSDPTEIVLLADVADVENVCMPMVTASDTDEHSPPEEHQSSVHVEVVAGRSSETDMNSVCILEFRLEEVTRLHAGAVAQVTSLKNTLRTVEVEHSRKQQEWMEMRTKLETRLGDAIRSSVNACAEKEAFAQNMRRTAAAGEERRSQDLPEPAPQGGSQPPVVQSGMPSPELAKLKELEAENARLREQARFGSALFVPKIQELQDDVREAQEELELALESQAAMRQDVAAKAALVRELLHRSGLTACGQEPAHSAKDGRVLAVPLPHLRDFLNVQTAPVAPNLGVAVPGTAGQNASGAAPASVRGQSGLPVEELERALERVLLEVAELRGVAAHVVSPVSDSAI